MAEVTKKKSIQAFSEIWEMQPAQHKLKPKPVGFHVLQAEFAYVDLGQDCVLFRVGALVPHLRNNKKKYLTSEISKNEGIFFFFQSTFQSTEMYFESSSCFLTG
jgi:hypothetical protein